MNECTIWSTTLGSMERLGSTRGAGIVPEGVSYTWDVHGPSKASFSLKRTGGGIWPDLAPLAPIDIDVNGSRVWSGRISEAPQQTGDSNVISVQCEGWQYHLEDDMTKKLYVHNALSDMTDLRSWPGTALGAGGSQVGAAWTVTTSSDHGNNVLVSLGAGNTAGANNGGAAYVDVGVGLSVKRIVTTFASSNNNANTAIYVMGLNTAPDYISATNRQDVISGTANNAGASGSGSLTLSPTTRYVEFLVFTSGLAATAIDVWFKLTSLQLFGSAAWESGGASILKASDVLADLLPLAPLLRQSTAKITASSFNIPELYVSTMSTPGEIMRAVNAYHDWLLQVDQYRQLVFAPKPTLPALLAGSWSNAQVTDTSAGTSTDVYNKCYVTGQLADGTNDRQPRTITSPILDAQGVIRSKNIDLQGITTNAAMIQLGDTFLAGHNTLPFKGSISGKGDDAFRTLGGSNYGAFNVPTQAGQLLRLDHWIDPNTGGLGRDGRIAEATYSFDTDTVDVTLDNTRNNFEAFLARLQILTSTALNSN